MISYCYNAEIGTLYINKVKLVGFGESCHEISWLLGSAFEMKENHASINCYVTDDSAVISGIPKETADSIMRSIDSLVASYDRHLERQESRRLSLIDNGLLSYNSNPERWADDIIEFIARDHME